MTFARRPLTKCNLRSVPPCAPATPRETFERTGLQRFRVARALLGWTQLETAERLYCARSTVERWESSDSTLPAWALVALETFAAQRKAAA